MATQTPSSDVVLLAPVVWDAARLSIHFVAEVAVISSVADDLLEPMVITAILEANQAELATDPRLQQAYGDAGAPLPDALRRPISVNAVAQSLGLSFETVRRRMVRLQAQGQVHVTPAGVYVPVAAVTSEAYLARQARRVARLGAFRADLAALGLLPARAELGPVGVRAADRALAQYILRVCARVMQIAGGAMDALVLLGLCAENTEHLGGVVAGGLPHSYAAATRPADAIGVSRRLRMPRETVRRHLVRLQAKGLAERGDAGWTAAARGALADQAREAADANLLDLRRLFRRLDELDAASHAAERRAAAASGGRDG